MSSTLLLMFFEYSHQNCLQQHSINILKIIILKLLHLFLIYNLIFKTVGTNKGEVLLNLHVHIMILKHLGYKSLILLMQTL